MASKQEEIDIQSFQAYVLDLSNAVHGISQSVKNLTKESFKFSPTGSESASDTIPSAMVSLDDQTRDSVKGYVQRLLEMVESIQNADDPPVSSEKLKRSLRMAVHKANLSRIIAQTIRNRRDSEHLISALHDIQRIIENENSDTADSKEVPETGDDGYVQKIAAYIKAEIRKALQFDDLTVNVEEFKQYTEEVQRYVNLANKALENNIEQLNLIVSGLENLGMNKDQQGVLNTLSNSKEPLKAMHTRLEESIALLLCE